MATEAQDAAQPAWVLHARPYRETSLLVEALTLHGGRLGFVARGVRGPRGHALRAALQPFQPLTLSLRGRGELATLAAAEVHDAALRLSGDSLLAAFYVNELVLRLLPRQLPSGEVFWRYALCLNALAEGSELAWTLRCFERDLLVLLGHAPSFEVDGIAGAAVDAQGWYRLEPERGLVPAPPGSAAAIPGRAFVALRGDQPPDAAVLREVRGVMRQLIAFQLGGRPLRTRRVLAELGAVRSAGPSPSEP